MVWWEVSSVPYSCPAEVWNAPEESSAVGVSALRVGTELSVIRRFIILGIFSH